MKDSSEETVFADKKRASILIFVHKKSTVFLQPNQ